MSGSAKVRAIVAIVGLAGILALLGGGCKLEERKIPPKVAPPTSPTPQQQVPPYEQRRADMVEALKREGMLESAPVIAAMTATPRHLFVPEQLRPMAYFDTPLPIGEDQTISAPGIVAKMTELLAPQPDDIVLEIGTGSGYQAAVLTHVVKHVYTIEIVRPLADSARQRLQKLGYENVTVRWGDGYKGWPKQAPFDGIIVTCAPEQIPQPRQEQLKEGGRMGIPVGRTDSAQWLYLLEKHEGVISQTAVLPVRFVPMTGEAQMPYPR